MKNSMFTRSCCIALSCLFLLSLNPLAAIAQVPANDLCGNPQLITSGATCSPVSGSLRGTGTIAAATGGISAFCGSAASGDVWYTFQAQSAYPTITINNMGNLMDDAPRLQLFNTTSCTVATLNASSIACGTGTTSVSITPPYTSPLTVGAFYLVRVFTNATTTGGTTTRWGFDICVTDPAPVANDLCANATPITSSVLCNNTAGTLNTGSSYTAIADNCTTNSDVWYSFTAQSTNPSIAISGALANARYQVYTAASCGGTPVSAFCSSAASEQLPAGTLTVGQPYLVRVYSTSAFGTFNICIQDPPANDPCTGAIPITSSSTTCTNTAGELGVATYTAMTGACGTNRPDVWYSFTAQSSNPSIAISGALANARYQIYTAASCGGTVSSQHCSSAATEQVPAGTLTVGQSYLVRVYSNTGATGAFNICIQDPPANDPCTGAIPLTSSSTSCTNTAGELGMSTYTAMTGACGTSRPDVWYSFTAQSPTPNIALSGALTNARYQIYTAASCGGTPATVYCSTTPAAQVPVGNALTVGQQYLIRVYSTSATTGSFNICIQDPPVNDLCANATLISSSSTGCNTTWGTLNALTGFTAITGNCGTNPDVWYRFVAQSTNPIVTIGTLGTSARFQIYTAASCGGTVSNIYCSAATTVQIPVGNSLVVGQQYLIRVYSNTSTAGDFSICIQDPPANDLCANAQPLTPSSSCNPTSGTTSLSNYTAITGACDGTRPDVWYSFTAGSTNPAVTVAGLTNARFQIYTAASCGGTVTNVYCGTAAAQQVPVGNSLTVGQQYLLRVYSTSTTGNFTVCIQDQVPPSNDECTGAVTLNTFGNCDKIYSTIAGATASSPAIAATCGTPTYDVWFKFVAVATTSTITVGDLGSAFTNTRLQLFPGTCGALGTPLYCITGTAINATGLTAGQTYYVRVFTTNTTPTPAINGDFSICVSTTSANIPPRLGNSYVNLTKKTTGGTVEPGDILEIRTSVYYAGTTDLYRPRFLDNIPTNTEMVVGGANEYLGVITNEGVSLQSFTLGAGDDAGTYNSAPVGAEYNVRMNLGFGVGTTGGAFSLTTTGDLTGTNSSRMRYNDYPRASANLLFVTAFRVRVTGTEGQMITLGTGSLIYRPGGTGAADITLNTTPYQILISAPQTLCTNSTGVNNAVEFGGTFGSGSSLNRGTDLISPINNYTYTLQSASQGVNDGRYSIVKNTSPRNGTNPNASRQPNCTPTPANPNDACDMRMFGGYWDIIGDHTGTNNSTGNAPPAANTSGGYMLVVNSDNVTSTVYRQSLNNLCPNTYYEFSAWFRNICAVCGTDQTNSQTNLPGINPNLTFVLNDVDRYSTGEIEYANGWVKKGFVFKTEPGQTSINFAIRTNSPGGGGNDWAMDDISITTCLPSMRYSPSLNPTVCVGNSITLNDTIISFFDNYTYFKWQHLPVGESTWVDIPGTTGSASTTTLPSGEHQYITSYTVPLADAQEENNGDRYRVIVATAAENLDDITCNVTDGISIIDVQVLDCGVPLKTDMLAFNGRLVNDHAQLAWTTSKEEAPLTYEIERSYDGRNFTLIGKVNGYNNGATTNQYGFTDMAGIQDKAWYRIAIVNAEGKKKYSSIIQLKKELSGFGFVKVINPFSQQLDFDVVVTTNSLIHIDLLDVNGRSVRNSKQIVYAGVNSIQMKDVQSLPAGVYTLRVIDNGHMITKRVLKMN